MFELRCRDVGFDCAGVVRGGTREEVLAQAAAHAGEVHHTTVTPALAEKVFGLIRPLANATPGVSEKPPLV